MPRNKRGLMKKTPKEATSTEAGSEPEATLLALVQSSCQKLTSSLSIPSSISNSLSGSPEVV
jgi:hypothetical protein